MYHTYRSDSDTVIDEFDSTLDVLAHMHSSFDKNEQPLIYGSQEYYASLVDDRDEDWTTYSTFNGYLNAVETENDAVYQSVFDQAESAVREITQDIHWDTVTYKRTREHASTGMRLHRSRLYSGKAHKAFARHRRQARLDKGGVVTIVIPVSATFEVSASSIYLYRLAGYVLASVLERIGKQTEIFAYAYKADALSERWGRLLSYVWLHRIKGARERYQINAFVPLLFADYNRRFGFRAMEMQAGTEPHTTQIRVEGGYGRPRTHMSEAWTWLMHWAEQRNINPDTLLMAPNPQSGTLRSVADVQEWVQETLDALNQPMSA